VIGILAAYAIPQFVGRSGFDSRAYYDQSQAVVRYAQKIAIAQRRSLPTTPIYVVVTANQIQVCYDSACASPVSDSSGLVQTPLAPSGVTLSPATTFSFDGSGAPSAAATINVNSSGVGDPNRTFFVEATTGYVHP
jgi:MSHA pilin protein MshC